MLAGSKTPPSTVAGLLFGPLEASATVLLHGDSVTVGLATSAVDTSTTAGAQATCWVGLLNGHPLTIRMSAGESLYAVGSTGVSWLVSYD